MKEEKQKAQFPSPPPPNDSKRGRGQWYYKPLRSLGSRELKMCSLGLGTRRSWVAWLGSVSVAIGRLEPDCSESQS